MKNTIIINIDTDSDRQITFSKPDSIAKPTTQDEAKAMVNNDIVCVCEGLVDLISIAEASGFGSTDEYISHVVERLNSLKAVEDETVTKTEDNG